MSSRSNSLLNQCAARLERLTIWAGPYASLLQLLLLGLSIPLIATYFDTGLVPRLPTAVLAVGMMLIGFLSLTCGLILDTVTHGRREIKRLAYLTISSTGARAEERA